MSTMEKDLSNLRKTFIALAAGIAFSGVVGMQIAKQSSLTNLSTKATPALSAN